MPRWLKFTGLGCGGLLGLFILLGACAAILAPPAEDTASSPIEEGEQDRGVEEAAPDPEPQDEPEPEPVAEPESPAAQTVAIGEPLAVGDVAWVVTSARQRDQLQQREFGEFGETKQGNFVVVNFEFTNNSNEPITLDTLSITLVDDQGRESNPDTDTFGYVPQELDPFLTQVNPGVTQPGRVIFTVAPDASGFRLRLGDAAFFGDEEGFVRLGF